jgi:lauroyl/myristoyl acyltransferase
MFIGSNKDKVIENMKKAVLKKDFNCKVEVDDPDLSLEEKEKIISNYLKSHKTIGYRICNIAARAIIDTGSKIQNKNTRYVGLENIAHIKGGAVVTSNHFNPLDNTAVSYGNEKERVSKNVYRKSGDQSGYERMDRFSDESCRYYSSDKQPKIFNDIFSRIDQRKA